MMFANMEKSGSDQCRSNQTVLDPGRSKRSLGTPAIRARSKCLTTREYFLFRISMSLLAQYSHYRVSKEPAFGACCSKPFNTAKSQ